MSDEDFKPELGRMKARGGKGGRSYLGEVVAAAARSGTGKARGNSRFDGSRIGRGASMGRLLSSRAAHAGLRARRAVVKTRLVKLGTKGLSGVRAHLKYIQRDGVTPEGLPGQLYAAEQDVADGKVFLERADGDRHQFRFIVSAEDGDLYPDLKPFVRTLMRQAEADLGTKLDWVAADHFNTGHPHSHIILRGKDDKARDLIIAREYIAHGLRARAVEIVNRDLGPRTDLEIENRLRHDVEQERLTAIDRQLVRDMDEHRTVGAMARDPFTHALRAGRLQKLGRLGLAEKMGAGRWRLADDLETTLKQMGERGDIIRSMQREITARKLDRPGIDQTLFDPGAGSATPLVGRVLARGLSDELYDRHYLLVDGVDGRVHHVDIGRGDATEPTPECAVVRVVPLEAGIREVDRTVLAIARAGDGRYSVDRHLRHDPNASEAFAQAHVRRLEAMRRLAQSVERGADGSWAIADDHLDRAAVYEATIARDRPVQVEMLSAMPVERLDRFDGATWLDRTLVGAEPLVARDTGFGGEVRTAQAQRRQWLLAQGLAEEQDGTIRYRANLLAILQRRELLRVAGQLSQELGLEFSEARAGARIDGRLVRRIDLASGPHALVEKSREFTLVPWRRALEKQLGRQVSGIMRGSGISWTIGRGRDGPSIS